MDTNEILFGVVIVLVTSIVGVYYALRQCQTLRRLRTDVEMPDEERAFLHSQAWRRMAGSCLMVLFAGMFVGLFFIQGWAQELVNFGEAARARDETPELSPEQKRIFRIYAVYVIVLMLVLMGMIAVAGYEFFAIRRFSIRSQKQIQADRRAMVDAEVARIRSERGERNGHV